MQKVVCYQQFWKTASKSFIVTSGKFGEPWNNLAPSEFKINEYVIWHDISGQFENIQDMLNVW